VAACAPTFLSLVPQLAARSDCAFLAFLSTRNRIGAAPSFGGELRRFRPP
jgi:hypothetical protein